MGQYYTIVNVDKKEYIKPHWLKLKEFGCSGFSEMMGLSMLMMNDPNTYMSEMKDSKVTGLLNVQQYAKPKTGSRNVFGRWAGDRIIISGDYAEDGDKGETLSHIVDGKRTFISGYDAMDIDKFKDITNTVMKAVGANPFVLGVNVYDLICGYDYSGRTASNLKDVGMPKKTIELLQGIAKRSNSLENDRDAIEKSMEGFVDDCWSANVHQAISGQTTAAYVNVTRQEVVRAVEFGGAATYSGAIIRNNFTQCLPALLATSSGRGGGDIRSDSEHLGSWAGDVVLYVDNYKDQAYSDYTNISQQVLALLCEDAWIREEYEEQGMKIPKLELTTA